MSHGVYYNDNDPFVCQWLENLIAAGLLPTGRVDCRPIEEVKPEDVEGFTQCHFFAGIGGWPYALQLAGWGDRPVWTGSCPCQPFSAAGQGKAADDPRHLWPHWLRLIRECRPRRIFGEQVANAAGHGWWDVVSTELEAETYTAGACVLGAHSVGAPHLRQRLYWMADADGPRLERRRCEVVRERASQQPIGESSAPAILAHAQGASGRRADESTEGGNGGRQGTLGGCGSIEIWDTTEPRIWQQRGLEQPQTRDTGWGVSGWESEPNVGRVADGVPARVGRLRAYGNAIVPQVAAAFVKAYTECVAGSALLPEQPQ